MKWGSDSDKTGEKADSVWLIFYRSGNNNNNNKRMVVSGTWYRRGNDRDDRCDHDRGQ